MSLRTLASLPSKKGPKFKDTTNKGEKKMNYHQLPCGTRIPPEGLKAWVSDNDNMWFEGKIIAYKGDDCIVPVIVESGSNYTTYTLTDPNAKKRRLMTPVELWKKAVYSPSTDRWLAVSGISQRYVFMIGHESGASVEQLVKHGYKWADHPSAEVHDSFEVEE